MNRKNILLNFLLIFIFASCQKEENSNNEREIKGRFDNIPFKWDYVFASVTDDQKFIGDQSISIENRMIITQPMLYIGAAYHENDFGYFLSPEIISARNPIDVIFDFAIPFVGTINQEHGSIGYKSLLAESLKSKQYKEFTKNRHSPFEIRLSEVFSNQDICKAFPNNTTLGKAISDEVKKEPLKGNSKSLLIGELRSNSFTVYMDFPPNGLFKDEKVNRNDNSVYIRSITYGKVAYFIIESSYPYKDIESTILSKFSLHSATDKGILEKSEITLFAISDNLQTAKVFKTFQDLDYFINDVFTENIYGYPIYCQGVYTKDNTVF